MNNKRRRFMFGLMVMLLISLLHACQLFQDKPKTGNHLVNIYSGKYDAENKRHGKPASGFTNIHQQSWEFDRDSLQSNLHLGVLFPNLPSNDTYWTSVLIGVIHEAMNTIIEQGGEQWSIELSVMDSVQLSAIQIDMTHLYGIAKELADSLQNQDRRYQSFNLKLQSLDRRGEMYKQIRIDIELSKSYDYVELHKAQFEKLTKSGVSGIIIGPIDYRRMDAKIAEVTKNGISVIAVTNDVFAPEISGKVLVSYHEMGWIIGDYIKEHALERGDEEIIIGVLPGPDNVGWAPESMLGLAHSFADFPVSATILSPKWGVTTKKIQHELIVELLKEHGKLDYIVANGVAAEVAVQELSKTGDQDIHILSTYYTPSLDTLLKAGKVMMATDDNPELIGAIAFNRSLILSKGKAKDNIFRISPEIVIKTHENL